MVELAEEKGWTYDETSDGHPRLSPPAGLADPYKDGRPAAPVIFGKTPSDRRGDKNAASHLRRLGVEIPHKGHTQGKENR
ncbi:hypothetical protein GCM10009836_68890 [Pseudonocardia ailaonensis]|uniref:Uncharacterized protein n=1 Tax=Pseudonocardia ailaonensis TaxID=367279 RepID=A0ABN2NP18_9PSEU